MLEATHPERDVRPGHIQDLVDVRSATRSDHIVGICYLVGLKSLKAVLRYRAAAELIALCHDAGYVEARRLLPKSDWRWLTSALRTSDWPRLTAIYFIEDDSVPADRRVPVARAFLETASTAANPPGIDDLINSSSTDSSDRLRLAVAMARCAPTKAVTHLTMLTTDPTMLPEQRAEATKVLNRLEQAQHGKVGARPVQRTEP